MRRALGHLCFLLSDAIPCSFRHARAKSFRWRAHCALARAGNWCWGTDES